MASFKTFLVVAVTLAVPPHVELSAGNSPTSKLPPADPITIGDPPAEPPIGTQNADAPTPDIYHISKAGTSMPGGYATFKGEAPAPDIYIIHGANAPSPAPAPESAAFVSVVKPVVLLGAVALAMLSLL